MSIKNLRIHQERARTIGEQIHDGLRDEKTIVVHVTPGGGKTLMASLFAHQLLRRDVSHVLVVCPRVSLQTQMRDGFTVPALGLHAGLVVGYATSRGLFRGERAGCVTTYQDVVANPARWLRFVSQEPTLVILDEAHHLPDGAVVSAENADEAKWTAAVRPIVDAAKRVLVMTGSLRRSEGEPIAFIEYDEERQPKTHIRYVRRHALDEQAVLNVSVQLADGVARFWHPLTREKHEHRLSAVGARDEAKSRQALLDSDTYRSEMIRLAVDEFGRYRHRNPSARMIVICHTQAVARAVADLLHEDGSYRPVLAISSEPNANARISRFRDRREGEILVTVGMAYEGLDVPDCTHLVCLSDRRARPWLEQALSRVTRFDPKCGLSWEEQCGYIYVPNDPSMVQFVAEWIDEQDARFADPPIPRDGDGEFKRKTRVRMVTEESELDGVKFADTFGMFSEIDQRRISAVLAEFEWMQGMPAAHLLEVGRRIYGDDADVPHVAGSGAAAE